MTIGGGDPVDRAAVGERRARALTWAAAAFSLVVVFEAGLVLAAVTLFGHLDTPGCAGADTFCSPSGAAGPTGGAVVVLVGNLAAAAMVAALLGVVLRRRGIRSR